ILNVFDYDQVYGSVGFSGFYVDTIDGSGANSNTFVYNTVHNNPVGFTLGEGIAGTTNNTIAHNTIYSNNAQTALSVYHGIGILLNVADSTHVFSNLVFNNQVGISAKVNALTPLGGGGGNAVIANNIL